MAKPNVATALHAWVQVGGYDFYAKQEFHRAGRKALKALADALDLREGTYEVRSNLAGPACSGEVTLHGERIYIQVQASCLGPGHEILYRTCNGRKDYCGGQNHFAPVEALLDPEAFAAKVRRLLAPKFMLIA